MAPIDESQLTPEQSADMKRSHVLTDALNRIIFEYNDDAMRQTPVVTAAALNILANCANLALANKDSTGLMGLVSIMRGMANDIEKAVAEDLGVVQQ